MISKRNKSSNNNNNNSNNNNSNNNKEEKTKTATSKTKSNNNSNNNSSNNNNSLDDSTNSPNNENENLNENSNTNGNNSSNKKNKESNKKDNSHHSNSSNNNNNNNKKHNNNEEDEDEADEEETVDEFLLCPICDSMIKEPFITKCGHSFCYQCITQHLTTKKTCPYCMLFLTREQIFPNFALNKFVQKVGIKSNLLPSPTIKQLRNTLTNEKFSLHDINLMVNTLLEKKKSLELQDQQVEFDILLDFLQKTKSQKMEDFRQLKRQIDYLENDIKAIEHQKEVSDNTKDSTTTTTLTSSNNIEDSISINNNTQNTQLLSNKKRRVEIHLEDLQSCYFSAYNDSDNDDIKSPKITTTTTTTSTSTSSLANGLNSNINNSNSSNEVNFSNGNGSIIPYISTTNINNEIETLKVGKGLLNFSKNLLKFTRYNEFKVIATLKYGDLFNTSSIVSSIEFDRDQEFFATAGVTKKIKVFEFSQIRDNVDVHTPVKEMLCRSKISCLSWNTYIKSQIASSDYEGIISLWDSNTGQSIMTFEEHEKRVWSVDFSRTDPTQLASGSDDTKVKLWSTNTDHAITTIESKANICCVKFNPSSSNLIAFGSADHHIHYYDLRQYKDPLLVFKGHRKAVSYVKFMNKDELISASTDSTLKLWNVNSNECIRTFTGHSNEKNFVGLTVNGDYICCGSENNGVYTYYKTLSKPIVTHKFGANSGTGDETDEDGSQFVSSVCWKKDSNILLAANSQGNIKILELQ